MHLQLCRPVLEAEKQIVDLSICIVTMNHWTDLDRCLASILKDLPVNRTIEIIIIDNCSSDGTRENFGRKYSKYNFIWIHENKEIKTFAANNNIAYQKSHGKYILFLNPDTIIHDNALLYMMEYMQHNAKVGISGCKLKYPDGSVQESARRFITWKFMIANKLFHLGIDSFREIVDKYVLSNDNVSQVINVDYIIGAFMLCRREALKATGVFDERFIHYAEDTDLCFRMWQNGWKVTYVPFVTVTHFYNKESQKRIFNRAFMKQIYTAFLFYMKNYCQIVK